MQKDFFKPSLAAIPEDHQLMDVNYSDPDLSRFGNISDKEGSMELDIPGTQAWEEQQEDEESHQREVHEGCVAPKAAELQRQNMSAIALSASCE